jgi:hypothetical protein
MFVGDKRSSLLQKRLANIRQGSEDVSVTNALAFFDTVDNSNYHTMLQVFDKNVLDYYSKV